MMSALLTLLPVNTETSLFGVQAVNNTMRGKEHGRSSLSCTALIQEALGKRNLTPREHIVDAGYIDPGSCFRSGCNGLTPVVRTHNG
jgi:hypothetical protein